MQQAPLALLGRGNCWMVGVRVQQGAQPSSADRRVRPQRTQGCVEVGGRVLQQRVQPGEERSAPPVVQGKQSSVAAAEFSLELGEPVVLAQHLANQAGTVGYRVGLQRCDCGRGERFTP